MSNEFQQNILIELNSESSETSQEQEKVIHEPFKSRQSNDQNYRQTIHFLETQTQWHSDFFDSEFHKRNKKLEKSMQFSSIWHKQQLQANNANQNKNKATKCLSFNCSTQCQNKSSESLRQISIIQDDIAESKVLVPNQLFFNIPKQNTRSFSENNIHQQQKQAQLQQVFRKYSIDQNNQKEEIILQAVNHQIYLRLGKQVIEICQQTKNVIDYMFLKKLIVVPIVQPYIFTCNYSQIFWQLLFKYLSSINLQLFKQTITQITIKKKILLIKNKKSANHQISLLNYFTKKNYSKAQLLKNHAQNKLNYLYKFSKYNKNGKREEKQILQNLAYLQMIISFENAIEYCRDQQRKNVQTNQQLKWRELIIKTIKQMKKWINQNNMDLSV